MRLTLFLAFILLSACVPPQKKLPPQLVDNTFNKGAVLWAGEFRGATTEFHTKLFDSGGMLAICAVRAEETGIAEEVHDTWFSRSFVHVGGQRVAPAKFMSAAPDHARERWANCIETETRSEGKLHLPVHFRGDAVTVWN